MFTVEDYVQALQNGERWLELVDGDLQRLTAPDDRHGNVIRNLSKAYNPCLKSLSPWFPCYELGIVIGCRAQTVRCPAISWFPLDLGLELAGQLITTHRPELIVEIVSSPQRRRMMDNRLRDYLSWGIPEMWVVDCMMECVEIFGERRPTQRLESTEILSGLPPLESLEIRVADLFRDPDWARYGLHRPLA